MEYSLSNSLAGGSGSLNLDKLSLDLQFATDKTLTARRGPTPVFTRASTGTFVGSNGYIQSAAIDSARFDHDTSYVGSSVYVTSSDAVGQSGLPLPSERVYFGGIDGNGYPEFFSDMYYISFASGQWILNGDGGNFQAYSNNALSDEYVTATGTGFVVVVLTLACKGLLIEESRTNLCLQSNAFSTSPWGNINTVCAITQNETGVDGVVNSAWTFTDDSVINSEGRYSSASLTSGVACSYSIFVKKTTGTPSTYPAIWLARSGTFGGCVINTTAGTATPITALGAGTIISTTASVVDFGNFWRVTSFVTPTSTGSWEISISPSGNGTGTGVMDGTSTGSAVFWGAQLEAGAFATSYIPTTTTTLQRTADVCSITGSAFSGFYNQSEGTLFANIQSTGSGDRRPIALDIGNNSQFYNFYSTSALSRYAQASGSSGSFTMAGTVPSTPLRYAGTIKDGDYSLALNGSIVGSSTATLNVVFTTIRIGAGGGGGGQFLCGHIAAIRYYKKRLPNAKLQAITA